MHAVRSLASALVISTTFIAGAFSSEALASTTYLVQLGSYESDAQAQEQWNKVKKRFPNIFGSLQYMPKTVKMPPDNVVYHRTQAGPLKSRNDAEAICDDLQVSGYECYVVETAIGNTAPATVATPNPEPVKTVEKTEEPAQKVASLPTLPLPDKAVSADAKMVPAPAAPLPAPIVTPAPKTDVKDTKKEALPKAVTAANDKEIETLFAQANKEETPKKPEVKTEAKQEKPAAPAPKTVPVSAPAAATIADDMKASTPTDTVSFLDRITKKLDKTASTPAAAPEPEPQSAPAEPKEAPKVTRDEAPAQEPTPVAKAVTYTPEQTTAPDIYNNGSPFQMGESRYAYSSPPVTDPKAPLPWLGGNRTAMAEVTPSTMTPVKEFSAPQPIVSNPTAANVEVAEAIRVPLSTMPQPEVKPSYDATPNAEQYGYPSQSLAKANLWAEVGYFPNQTAALGYWQTLQERAQDLPEGLRVRVIRPFMSHRSGEQVSVRVGPFASADAIRSLCKATEQEQLNCKSVKEFGDSSTSDGERKRYDSSQRYYQRKFQMENKWKPMGFGASNDYYIQLGAYASPVMAQSDWDSLKSSHEEVFAGVSEQIISPRYSSSSEGRYRLRAGPFGSNVSAVNACEQLRRDGILCVVVPGN